MSYPTLHRLVLESADQHEAKRRELASGYVAASRKLTATGKSIHRDDAVWHRDEYQRHVKSITDKDYHDKHYAAFMKKEAESKKKGNHDQSDVYRTLANMHQTALKESAPANPDATALADRVVMAADRFVDNLADTIDNEDWKAESTGSGSSRITTNSARVGHAGGEVMIHVTNVDAMVEVSISEEICQIYADDIGVSSQEWKDLMMAEIYAAAKYGKFEKMHVTFQDGIDAAFAYPKAPAQHDAPATTQAPVSLPSGRYDPAQAYLDRMTPAAQALRSRRLGHQFADHIGGHSANYKKGW